MEISSTMQNTDSKSTSMPPDREAFSLMTKLKLDRFKQRQMKFEDEYAQIIVRQNDPSLSPIDKVQMLSKSIEKLFGEEGKDRYLTNSNALIAIAKANTSTSTDVLENLYLELMKVISGGKKCSEYNYLFGLIMSQWLSKHTDQLISPLEVQSTSESLLTNQHLEKIIFERPQLDLDYWRNFLQQKLFFFFESDPKLKSAFEDFKLAIKKYGKSLLIEKVSSTDVRRAMDGLISTNIMDEHRKRLLAKMRLDDSVVNEFASSMTLMISDLSEWRWPTEGVRGVFRRNLVGRYRCFYEEDFLTAIFLEHIGLQWSYVFKRQLKSLFDVLTKKSQLSCSPDSIQHERLTMQQNEYWMASLPDEAEPQSGIANYANMEQLDLKTKLFHLVNVEIQLHQVVRPDTPFTVVSTDLEWFGPSVSHEIVQIFLQCCGVPQIWLDFFDRFLKQPVYYKPGEPVRQRLRGVPISHSISFLFSELLLFGMDLYVYQTTGIFNYRLHDDFWFFHYDSAKIEQAWILMNEYAKMTGLKFNEEKCGSMRIQPSNETNHPTVLPTNTVLPSKGLKWGLLTLQSSGRFLIDRNALMPFLGEMKVRLTKTSSILEWVQIYNQYISFFLRNFGKCVNALGTYHIEQMTEIFQFLHRYVFPETSGNALTMLKSRIMQEFPSCLSNGICEAWFYWPLMQGGLDMKNIYLTLYSFHAWFLSTKPTTFNQLPAKDTEYYDELVEEYAQLKKTRQLQSLKELVHEDGTLITFDEYIQGRETQLIHWKKIYQDMLAITPMSPPEINVALGDDITIVEAGIQKVAPSRQSRSRGRGRHSDHDDYIQWLVCYYGGQIRSTFNQLDFIDSDNLPIGLIMLMKTAKIDWNKDSKDHE